MTSEIMDKLREQFSEEKCAAVAKLLGARSLRVELVKTQDTVLGYIHIPHFAHTTGMNYEWQDKLVGSFQLSPLPGDGDVIVSSGVHLEPKWRGRGLGKFLHTSRLAAVKEAGASAMVCTVREENVPERKILFNNGWRLTGDYTLLYTRPGNPNGNPPHKVEFWMKEL